MPEYSEAFHACGKKKSWLHPKGRGRGGATKSSVFHKFSNGYNSVNFALPGLKSFYPDAASCPKHIPEEIFQIRHSAPEWRDKT